MATPGTRRCAEKRVRGESVILKCLPYLAYSSRSGVVRSRCHEFFLMSLTTYYYFLFRYKNEYLFRGAQSQSLGREDPREKGMATHSSILAWKIP